MKAYTTAASHVFYIMVNVRLDSETDARKKGPISIQYANTCKREREKENPQRLLDNKWAKALSEMLLNLINHHLFSPLI